MDVSAKTDAFVARWNGEYIDEDGWYGSQCWDLVARYAREEWGCPSFPTGSGGAEGLYRLFLAPISQYFDRVPASDLRKGDIAVWDASFYPNAGHTALVWERTGPNSIRVLEQDGSKDPNRDGKADGVSYVADRTLYKVSGGLRAKGANVEKINLSSARIIGFYILGRNGQNGKPNALDGQTDDDLKANHVGQPLTNEQLFYYYQTPEAQQTIGYQYDYGKIVATNKQLVADNAKILSDNKTLSAKLDAIDNGNTIIITKSGFIGLFDIIKQFFSKK